MTTNTNSPTPRETQNAGTPPPSADISGHSPLPWHQPLRYSPEDKAQLPAGSIESAGGEPIVAVCWPGHDLKRITANAALIVSAVNSHAELVKGLADLAAIATVVERQVREGVNQESDFFKGGTELLREATDRARSLLAKHGGG